MNIQEKLLFNIYGVGQFHCLSVFVMKITKTVQRRELYLFSTLGRQFYPALSLIFTPVSKLKRIGGLALCTFLLIFTSKRMLSWVNSLIILNKKTSFINCKNRATLKLKTNRNYSIYEIPYSIYEYTLMFDSFWQLYFLK